MNRNRPAFTFLGIESVNGSEPYYGYQINRSILLELARCCTFSTFRDRYENEAVTRFGFLCAELTNHPERRKMFSGGGDAFIIWNIGDIYISVRFKVSLLRPLGIALKKSTNKAVASWGLTMLSNFDNWNTVD